LILGYTEVTVQVNSVDSLVLAITAAKAIYSILVRGDSEAEGGLFRRGRKVLLKKVGDDIVCR
jgi:hypothetical protein